MVILDNPSPESGANQIPWNRLIQRIQRQRLTPFLGSAISHPPLPTGSGLAEAMAQACRYPFRSRELMEVAQYWATTEEPSAPKEFVQDLIARAGPVDLTRPDQPHALLASLPIPAYLTTNYDTYMEQALAPGHTPHSEFVLWNSTLQLQYQDRPPVPEPTVGTPVVYHLHGSTESADSFVITEDDYLDYIVNSRRYEGADTRLRVISPKIDALIAVNSLLFLGYSLRDWNLRVLLRTLVQSASRSSKIINVSVQLAPGDELVEAVGRPAAIGYLNEYFQGLNIKVYWGTLADFLVELLQRWEEARASGAPGAEET